MQNSDYYQYLVIMVILLDLAIKKMLAVEKSVNPKI